MKYLDRTLSIGALVVGDKGAHLGVVARDGSQGAVLEEVGRQILGKMRSCYRKYGSG